MDTAYQGALRLPIGLSSYDAISRGGYFHANKGRLISRIASGRGFMLRRPRGFGKTTLLSVLATIQDGGSQSLLHGHTSPLNVIRISLRSKSITSAAELRNALTGNLARIEKEFNPYAGMEMLRPSHDIAQSLRAVCNATGRELAILIDDFDSPFIDASSALLNSLREEMASFLAAINRASECVAFIGITATTAAGSDLAAHYLPFVADISADDEFATLCGLTDEELRSIPSHLCDKLSKRFNLDRESALELIIREAGGYRFSAASPRVVNPTLCFGMLSRGNIAGTLPLPFIDIRPDMANIYSAAETSVVQTLSDWKSPASLLLHCGLLTITSADKDGRLRLDVPNEAARRLLLSLSLKKDSASHDMDIPLHKMRIALLDGEPDNFLREMKGLMSACPYQLVPSCDAERHYHNVVFLTTRLLGLDAEAECQTSAGRIDMLVKTPRFIYIFEFKLDTNVAKASEQIDNKRYADAFLTDKRQIFLIGANFSSKTHSIDRWQIRVANQRPST